jgi:hypothetical protein
MMIRMMVFGGAAQGFRILQREAKVGYGLFSDVASPTSGCLIGIEIPTGKGLGVLV